MSAALRGVGVQTAITLVRVWIGVEQGFIRTTGDAATMRWTEALTVG